MARWSAFFRHRICPALAGRRRQWVFLSELHFQVHHQERQLRGGFLCRADFRGPFYHDEQWDDWELTDACGLGAGKRRGGGPWTFGTPAGAKRRCIYFRDQLFDSGRTQI